MPDPNHNQDASSSSDDGPKGQWLKIKQGDSIYKIAYKQSLDYKKIWEHDENKDLADRRKKPGVLLPGDRVFIPSVEPKSFDAAAEEEHRFRNKGKVKQTLKLKLAPSRGPVSSRGLKNSQKLKYELTIGDRIETGEAEPGELIEIENVPPDTEQVVLKVGKLGGRVFTLKVGHLDPYDEPSGAQQRLRNLGYGKGDTALASFKTLNGLDESASDADIQNKLKQLTEGES